MRPYSASEPSGTSCDGHVAEKMDRRVDATGFWRKTPYAWLVAGSCVWILSPAADGQISRASLLLKTDDRYPEPKSCGQARIKLRR